MLFMIVVLCIFSSCAYGMTLNPQGIVLETYMPYDATIRQSSYPRITGDTFRVFCDHKIDETQTSFDPQSVKYGDTVFVTGNLLPLFFDHIYPHITQRFVLVSHNAISMVPGPSLERYLDDEKIIAWFTRNPDRIGHPKLIGIPLGLANSYFPFGDREVGDRIIGVYNVPVHERPYLLYSGFNPYNNLHARSWVFRYFKKASFCYHQKGRVSYEEFLITLGKSVFVLSPRGTGLDCYRHWESLMMGAIPIILHSTLDPIFEDLPVLLVHSWKEVTHELLEKKRNEMHNKQYNMKKLYADYWFDLIRAYQARA